MPTRAVYKEIETVCYTQSNTQNITAVIKKVHFDDVEPYYTIQIDGHPVEKPLPAGWQSYPDTICVHENKIRNKLHNELGMKEDIYSVTSPASSLISLTFSPSASSFASPRLKSAVLDGLRSAGSIFLSS